MSARLDTGVAMAQFLVSLRLRKKTFGSQNADKTSQAALLQRSLLMLILANSFMNLLHPQRKK